LKKYRIDIKPTAENDLESRYLQIAEASPQNAVRWYLDIIEAIEKLDTLAERCPIAPEDIDLQKGIRHLVLGNYRVLYLINQSVVEVLHVRHGKMERKL
jgi:plasmid stabilization system protein ParE